LSALEPAAALAAALRLRLRLGLGLRLSAGPTATRPPLRNLGLGRLGLGSLGLRRAAALTLSASAAKRALTRPLELPLTGRATTAIILAAALGGGGGDALGHVGQRAAISGHGGAGHQRQCHAG
jgi:hypothetical protein